MILKTAARFAAILAVSPVLGMVVGFAGGNLFGATAHEAAWMAIGASMSFGVSGTFWLAGWCGEELAKRSIAAFGRTVR